MGRLLLNLSQVLFLAVWTAWWVSLALVVSFVSSEAALALARKVWAPGILWYSLCEVVQHPGPELDPKETVVFVCNHQSMLDIAVVLATLPVNFRFVLKHSLKQVPFLGWWAWRTGNIFVDRSHPRRAYRSLEQAKQRIRDGVSILAFPEGTRSGSGLLAFKRGAFALAQGAQVPVVPVAVSGSHAALPIGTFRISPAPIHVKIGTPIVTEDYGSSSQEISRLREDARTAIAGLLKELSVHVPVSEERAA